MAALTIRDIHKSFGDNEVLKGIAMTVLPGTVHGLVGGNGAGKSTLMKIINGVYARDSGYIEINGRPADYSTPLGARSAGVAMVYQEFSLIPSMTVAENLFLGREPRRWGLIDGSSMRESAKKVFTELNVDIDPSHIVKNLSVGRKQMVEIAKALLVTDASVLILDEPTASLSAVEIESLFVTIRNLSAKGIAVILVSHHLQEIMAICDVVTVLRDGISVLSVSTSETSLDEVITAMIGHRITGTEYIPPEISPEEVSVLSVRRLSWNKAVKDVSFDLHGGEVVGLVGIMGSGRTEIINMLYGLARPDEGSMSVDGKPYNPKHPADALSQGVALIPEDRRTCGIIGGASIVANVLLPVWRQFCRFGLIEDAAAGALAENALKNEKVAYRTLSQPAGTLSGGNQQKVVLAKN
ncbi:MAG: sugar ABC transporter ATP-binding protein, partial [Synergistaceae bacterium]|nr:sugar ABC transporter ATP-binding protein [Synergistaceae bacterium]